MTQPIPNDDGKRKKVVVDDENWYLTIGKKFLTVTVPHENRPDRREKRLVLDVLCEHVYSVDRGVFRADIVAQIEDIMGFSFNLKV